MPSWSVWSSIAHASIFVQCVMLILLLASLLSWTLMIDRFRVLKQAKQDQQDFDTLFRSPSHLDVLLKQVKQRRLPGLANVFIDGYQSYRQLIQQDRSRSEVLSAVSRVMHLRTGREMVYLQGRSTWLASIASVSPYIGLLGTVWGIITAFQALGQVGQASIAVVAPGVAEALVATAFGLVAAIPALVAYHRITACLDGMQECYELFIEELLSLFERQT